MSTEKTTLETETQTQTQTEPKMTEYLCGKEDCKIEKNVHPILACHKNHETDVEIKLATPGYNHRVVEIKDKKIVESILDSIAKDHENVMKPPIESISDLEHRLKNIVYESSTVTVGSTLKEKAYIIIPILAIIVGTIITFSHFRR